MIFSKDSAGQCLFVLVSGRVKIYSAVGGRSKTFALLDPGNFFGEMALLGEPVRSASARALMDTELLVLQRRDFQRFLKEDPRLTETVLRTLCDRLRKADQEIETLSFQNVLGRTASTIFDLLDKYGKKAPGGRIIDASIPQQDLADMIGTAREIVSRALARFKKMGAVSLDRATGKILVLNEQQLRNCIYR
jgi:CRP-like cAMP-binding protein